jgi:hypothetical protein
MRMKNIFTTVLLAVSFFIQNSCRPMECQSSPPVLRFQILDKNDKSLISKMNKDSLRFTFKELNGNTKTLSDLRVNVNDSTSTEPINHIIQTYELVTKSNQLKDSSFFVELNGKVLGKIQLKTFLNDEKCQGWITASEVLFNDKKTIFVSNKSLYILKVD